jgi:LmbE family N-acetylglucosaminyl deacetylase
MSGRRLALEDELIPYRAGFPPGSRWLVLAPHPDDEVFGPGATLAEAVARGVAVHVVMATDGGAQGDAGTREAEARAAAAALGIGEPEFWRLPDRGLDQARRYLRLAILGVLRRWRPELVLVPSPVELHPDHRAVALAFQSALRRWSWLGVRRRPPNWVAAYEVGTALRPNLLVAADATWERKLNAARCHASQLQFVPYGELMEALGSWRRMTLRGVARAEAFRITRAGRVARMSARHWAQGMGARGYFERRRA